MEQTTRYDVIKTGAKHVMGHGKNFKPLIASGSWTISGFHYGKSRCACCGRPITRVLHLKNESHEAAIQRDPNHPFPESIEIGIVCGPKVFVESCAGFYEDPNREWERQFSVWKDYINFVILCAQGKDSWEMLPVQLRNAVDDYLELGWKGEETTGKWHILRDSKKYFLRAVRRQDKKPIVSSVCYMGRIVLTSARRVGVIPLGWRLLDDLTIENQ